MDTSPERTTDAVDPWDWVDDVEEAEPVDLDAHRVTTILVGHDGAEWLRPAIGGLTALTHTPDRIVLVNAGSADDTGALFDAAAETHGWRSVPAPAGAFADAVRAGLTSLHGRDEDDRTDWVWLLHDDAVARPDALELLLTAAIERDAAIATPRLVQPATRQDPARVSELGVSVARSGRREVHVDAGEVDQGQHDTVTAVLGGSTCGLLIRRDVWDRLDGLNPALPAHRDGVDLGWRANLAGERVIAVPDACVEHRQVGLGGLRAGSERDAAADRSYGMALVAAHARGLGRVWTPLRLVLGSVLRVLGFLLGKAPDRASDEIGGLAGFVAGRGRVARLRKQISAVNPDARTRHKTGALRPGPFHGVRRLIDSIGAVWADRSSDGEGIDELTGDDFAGREQRFTWRGTYLVTAVLVIIAAVVASRRIFGQGNLSGPALLPAPVDLAHAFDQWLIPVGDWIQGPPWLGIHAALSFVLVGRPEWVTTVTVAGAVPLTLLAVWPLMARLLDDRRVRLWAGLSYALLPVLLGASTQGRLGLIATAILLPLVVRGIIGVISSAIDRHSWRAAWGTGVTLALLVAFQPIFGPLTVLALLIAVIAVGVEHGAGAVKALVPRAGLSLLVVAVALLPWWPTMIAQPSWWLLGPDAGLDGTAPAPAVWEFALGRPSTDSVVPLWISAIVIGALWVVAVAGAVLRPAVVGLRGAWAVALGGFALAVALTRLVVPAGIEQAMVRPSAAVPLLIGLGALVLAGAIGVDAVADGLAARDFSWVQPAAALAAVLMALTTVLGSGWWVVAGGSGPTVRSDVHLVPAFVTDELDRTPGTRGLAIEVAQDGTAHHVVFTGDGIHLGDADRGAALGDDAEAADRVAHVTRRLVAATGDETIAEDLRALGVRYVAVRAPDDLIGQINGTAGLRVVSVHPGERVWEVSDVTPAPAPETRLTGPQLGLAIGQGAWLVVAGFCAAPRLRASRSKDPVLRARFAAGQEVAR